MDKKAKLNVVNRMYDLIIAYEREISRSTEKTSTVFAVNKIMSMFEGEYSYEVEKNNNK